MCLIFLNPGLSPVGRDDRNSQNEDEDENEKRGRIKKAKNLFVLADFDLLWMEKLKEKE